MADAARIQHVENMRVRQSKLHESPPDTNWYIETANGFVVRGPFSDRHEAERALAIRRHNLEAMTWEDS